MIDSLYYGSKPCACCSGSPRNDLGAVIFSADILEDFLRKIYDGFDVSREIEPSAWREVLRILNEGAVKGLTQGGERQHTPQFLQAIKHSNEVFSAFKCHSMGVKMAERLHDKDGNLRPFKEWREAVQPIASHHVGAWLKTEYDTAVLRAHQGSLWQEFERNKDILPNLRWMPTTSVSPENVHKGYWTSRLTLPVDDPFWQDNHPANRWNCKCSLEATSDKADTGHVAEMARQDNTSQQGLENNPRDGRLFSDKHPYFPDSCSSCPFKKQSKLKNWIGRLFNGGDGKDDCYKNCPYVDEAIEQAKESREQTVRERADDIKNNGTIYINKATETFDNLQTGRLLRSKKPLSRLLDHCMSHRTIDAALDMWDNPSNLKFKRESPLGEGKDLSSSRAQKNIEKKKNRGVIGYNEYTYNYDGDDWMVKLEVHKKGFEQPYFIRLKEKKKTLPKEQP